MTIFKNFRNYRRTEVNKNTLSSRFDQPTYVSFKLIFADSLGSSYWNRDEWYNAANHYLYSPGTNYDKMPHPLFMRKGADSLDDRHRYSSIDYLLDANEYTRAQMLEQWQTKWIKLQNEFQWYFQKIEGVGDLLKIDPKQGIRVPQDKRLTITAMEGIDMRMSHLLNMYRKIAWDDTYQRWVLPDMMRYFTLKIYISEFRSFHTKNQYDGYGIADETYKDDGQLRLSLLDDVLPTWVIKCEMCEFDLESFEFPHLSNLNLGEDPEEATVKFSIKVGKIYEEQTYPVFENMYLYDRVLNGYSRSRTTDIIGDVEVPYNSTTIDGDATQNPFKTEIQIAQDHPSLYSDQQAESTHISGNTFNQMTNDDTMFGAKYNSNAKGFDSGSLLSQEKKFPWQKRNEQGWIEQKPDSPGKGTLFSNAVDWGTAFGQSAAGKVIDKAKITEIPGLGISFNEAAAAIQSKDIITGFGLLRKGVQTVINGYIAPSEKLEGDIIGDDLFKAYLEQLAGAGLSNATSEENEAIVSAANIVLSDSGIWEQIKDYSKATDLVGQGEENYSNPIHERNLYRDAVNEATQGDLSQATDLTGPGEPNITKNIEGGADYLKNVEEATQGDLSQATDLIGPGESNISNIIQSGGKYADNISEATQGNKSLATLDEPGTIKNKIIGEIIEDVPSSKATNSQILKG